MEDLSLFMQSEKRGPKTKNSNKEDDKDRRNDWEKARDARNAALADMGEKAPVFAEMVTGRRVYRRKRLESKVDARIIQNALDKGDERDKILPAIPAEFYAGVYYKQTPNGNQYWVPTRINGMRFQRAYWVIGEIA